MNSQEYILDRLNKIVAEYPFVQCTYQYDRFCNLHSVQILPRIYLNNPDGFGDLQYSIKKEFISLFPFERLSFFSIGNTVNIEQENYIATIVGKCFKNPEIEVFPDNTIHIENIDSAIDKEANYAL